MRPTFGACTDCSRFDQVAAASSSSLSRNKVEKELVERGREHGEKGRERNDGAHGTDEREESK